MAIANITYRGSVEGAEEFFKSILNPYSLRGLCSLFNLNLEGIKKEREETGLDFENIIFERLNNNDWSDEHIIEELLKYEKNKYFLIFNPENVGSFDIYEVKE